MLLVVGMPSGLVKKLNKCYLNAALQMIGRDPSLYQFFGELKMDTVKLTNNKDYNNYIKFLKEFQKMCRQLNVWDDRIVDPQQLMDTMEQLDITADEKLVINNQGQQKDAAELYSCFIRHVCITLLHDYV